MKNTESNTIKYKLVGINGYWVSVLEGGDRKNKTILLLHGYPENSWAFEDVMMQLKNRYHLLAVDLPGVGTSRPIPSGDKRVIAKILNELLETFDLEDVIIVGHDIGGMVVYAFLKYFPNRLHKAVIMNTAIPGIFPWEEVKRNPFIWHFGMFAIPDLPESLVAGKQRQLFDYFFNTLSADKQAISERKRQLYVDAYSNPTSLTTSFNWYRAFPHDEHDNVEDTSVNIPVLYIKEEKDAKMLGKYTEGLIGSGIAQLDTLLIPDCGHFAPEERPDIVAEAIHHFIVK